MDLQSRLPLLNGRTIPLLGLGVWKMAEGEETLLAVRHALEAGYRHIDTARLYANERSVGEAVRQFMQDSGTPREELFITTKLWPSDFLNPERGFDESFERLGLGYIVLYLIHWPAPLMPKNIWKTLERIYGEGRAHSIGISNYDISDIEKVLGYATVVPMVNQVEFNPASFDLELLEYCKDKNIVVEAYSPLGRGRLIKNATVAGVARRHSKTPAQVLIRWALQHGTVPLPKSSNPERIVENTKVFDFELAAEDIQKLDALG
jgi:diketogulonate reductase-like aldo/keto reductase